MHDFESHKLHKGLRMREKKKHQKCVLIGKQLRNAIKLNI